MRKVKETGAKSVVGEHDLAIALNLALGPAPRQQFGHRTACAVHGLAQRHDHGSNFMVNVSEQQMWFWGVTPSYAFVAEPAWHQALASVSEGSQTTLGAYHRAWQ